MILITDEQMTLKYFGFRFLFWLAYGFRKILRRNNKNKDAWLSLRLPKYSEVALFYLKIEMFPKTFEKL